MGWQIKEWMCGGFRAVRPDGEKIFIYRRLAWDPARYEERASSYEFRWHGLSAGRLITDNTWKCRTKLLFTLAGQGVINEQDLLEISMQLAGRPDISRVN
ncbi:MAG: hypothetical protein WCK75_11820 [Elusimicrobiota bacterium]